MSSPRTDSSRLKALQQENVRLKRAVEELSFLNTLALEIGSSLDSRTIMETIIRRSLFEIGAQQGVITLVDQKSKGPETLIRAMVSSTQQQSFHLDLSILGWMQINKAPLVITTSRGDERFPGVLWDKAIRSILCVPLMVRSRLIGVLAVYNKKGAHGFSTEDMRLLSIIAAQSAQVVENARLYEEEQALLKVQEELKLAANIQMTLLPKTAPSFDGYDIAGKSIPAQLVGGDYFDFIPLSDSCLAICLGDVSGKGLPASLLMSYLQATIRGQTLLESPCRDCLQRANRLLFQSTAREKFATLFFAILNTAENSLCFGNAGHNHPLLFSKEDQPVRLKTGGIPLGIREDFTYREESVSIQHDDVLLIYSDGISEAMNEEEEEFGLARLDQVVRENRDSSSTGLIEEILAAVNAHVGKAPQIDDITIVVVKRE